VARELAGGSSFLLALIQVCLLKRVLWRSHESLVVRLCVRLGCSGITGLHFKLKVEDWSICLLQVYASNVASEYQAFADKVKDVLLRVSPSECSEEFQQAYWN